MKARLVFRRANVFGLTAALSAGISLLTSTVPFLIPSANAQDNTWSSGFYRAANRNAVVFLDPDKKTSCNIVNEDQLIAYGGPRIVITVAPNSKFESGRTSRGACRWPNGFYKESNRNEIVHLFNRRRRYYICTVGSGDVLRRLRGEEQVRIVAPNSQLDAERLSDGECKV